MRLTHPSRRRVCVGGELDQRCRTVIGDELPVALSIISTDVPQYSATSVSSRDKLQPFESATR